MRRGEPRTRPAILQFESYLRSEGREASTIKLYVSETEHFLEWLASQGCQIEQVNAGMTASFRDELLARGMKAATVNKWMSGLSTFLRWAEENGLVRDNYAERGIAIITAVTVAAEIGDFKRFRHPFQLMAYLGLIFRVSAIRCWAM